ncbi:MAG: hypothetical protein LBN28_06325 [Desulfovibrio sp.]|nr:hypothetical protein [Desulfovibrio sp.]
MESVIFALEELAANWKGWTRIRLSCCERTKNRWANSIAATTSRFTLARGVQLLKIFRSPMRRIQP